ncbi:MAG TPA: hypothetical protein ENN53_04375 [Candidatus Acetothermia bacterium]|nr:hypothetical protein [Candidatus Acetothermia bacterium]
MRKVLMVALVMAAGAVAFAQIEEYRDLAYENKPFNPTDTGLVMRALLRDNDAGNRDPVYFTRVVVENLGTATAAEIEWVELRIEIEGQTRVLARSTGFPISEILLPRPAEERMLPDDGEAWLTVWIKVTERIVHGHTVQPRIRLWWSEGDEGGMIELVDAAPERFVVEGSFGAEGLPGPEGGILNPGDTFLVAEAEVWDTPDVNNLHLYVTAVRVDGPRELIWTVDINNGVTRIEVPAGLEVTLPEPAFAAFDEARGRVRLWVTVPPTFLPREPVTVAPTWKITVREGKQGPQEETFVFTDPIPDRVVAAGFEEVALSVPDAGRVLATVPSSLTYSTLTLTDADRNDTPIRVDSLELVAKGTVSSQVVGVELADARGNFLGYATGLGQLDLVAPDGKPILVQDDSSLSLVTTLLLGGKMPLGGSLLLAHRVKVEEKLPSDYLYRSTALTSFAGVQEAVPDKAIFFGQPRVQLEAVGSTVEVSTDGETVGTFQGLLKYTPTAPLTLEEVSLDLIAEPPYRVTQESLDSETGELAFRVEGPRTQARAGKLVTVQVTVRRVQVPQVEVAVELRDVKLVDWAGIELPFTLSPGKATISLTAVTLNLERVEDMLRVTADQAVVGSLLGAFIYEAGRPFYFSDVRCPEPYTVLAFDPQDGAASFRIGLVPGAGPAEGELLAATFATPEAVPVMLAIAELLDRAGKPYPYCLTVDAVEVGP